jgi:hypothetical protein
MRFNLERPDMRKALAGTQQDIERAVTSGMRDASVELKARLREDVVSSGLVEGPEAHRRFRSRRHHSLGARLLAGDSDTRRRDARARTERACVTHHARRLGTAHRHAAALRLPQARPFASGRRCGPHQHARIGGSE